MPVSIMLVDDQQIVRKGVRSLLEAEPDFSVVAEADNGEDAIDLIRRTKPDVVYHDIALPRLDGLSLIRNVRAAGIPVKMIVLTVLSENEDVLEALSLGADGYVLKRDSVQTLIEAVYSVSAGECYVSRTLQPDKLAEYALSHQTAALALYESLTPRERDVVPLAAQGLTNAEIGARLFISPRTVEIHRSRLMLKLNVRTGADLTRFAVRRGLIPLN